jgi:hypothetical protein
LSNFHQLFFVFGIFEMGAGELFAWAGHKLWSFWSLPPVGLGLQAWATGAQYECNSYEHIVEVFVQRYILIFLNCKNWWVIRSQINFIRNCSSILQGS